MSDTVKQRRILQPDQIDQLAEAVLALTREVWVTRDRMRILETVLAAHGLDVHDEIDKYQPDATLQAELDAERDRLLSRVVQALGGETA